jgi:hypothetical protein
MRAHRVLLATIVAISIVAALNGPVGAREVAGDRSAGAQAAPTPNGRLQMYEATVDAATANQLADQGYEIVSIDQVRGGVHTILVLYPPGNARPSRSRASS